MEETVGTVSRAIAASQRVMKAGIKDLRVVIT